MGEPTSWAAGYERGCRDGAAAERQEWQRRTAAIERLDVWPQWPGEPQRVPPPDEAMVGRSEVLAILRGTTDA